MSVGHPSSMLEVLKSHIVEQIEEIDVEAMIENDSDACDYARLQVSHISTLVDNLPVEEEIKKAERRFIRELEALIDASEEYKVEDHSQYVQHYEKAKKDLIDTLHQTSG